jgi:hypothetical protein
VRAGIVLATGAAELVAAATAQHTAAVDRPPTQIVAAAGLAGGGIADAEDNQRDGETKRR